MEEIKFNIPIKDLAPEGIHGYYYMVPQFEGEEDNDIKKFKDNEYREFHLKALLNRTSSQSLDINFNLDPEQGNSYLMIPEEHEGKKILKLKLSTSHGEFLFHKNKQNELSMLTFDCKAISSKKAQSKFYLGITPYLDYLSYKFNVPVMIDKISCEDKKNNITSISYVAPYFPKSAAIAPYGIPEEMIPIFALFREAKISSSPYYQFLCYFKILEGIYKKLRPELVVKAKLKNIPFKMEKEIIPSNAELRRYESVYIGKSILTLFRTEFRNEYRHAVSHFSLDDGTMINLSDITYINKYQSIIEIIEISCRVVIENQLKLIEVINK
ncbi:MAG: hypothetical protein IIC75_07780 [Bacteroidetes bacterium]|nr:hypothetical protein [Bacteroidota bacterium]